MSRVSSQRNIELTDAVI